MIEIFPVIDAVKKCRNAVVWQIGVTSNILPDRLKSIEKNALRLRLQP